MVNYKCQRCGYETNHKSVFKKHLLRKNLCKPKLNEITRYVLLCTNGFDEEATNFKLSTKNQQNIYKISTKYLQKMLIKNQVKIKKITIFVNSVPKNYHVIKVNGDMKKYVKREKKAKKKYQKNY